MAFFLRLEPGRGRWLLPVLHELEFVQCVDVAVVEFLAAVLPADGRILCAEDTDVDAFPFLHADLGVDGAQSVPLVAVIHGLFVCSLEH